MKMRLIRSFARSDGPSIVVSVTAITTNHIRKYMTPRSSAPSTRKFKRMLVDLPQLGSVVQNMVCTNIRFRLVPTANWKRANISFRNEKRKWRRQACGMSCFAFSSILRNYILFIFEIRLIWPLLVARWYQLIRGSQFSPHAPDCCG